MDVTRAALSFLLSCLALPAAAQTVYRCRSGDTWVYQDRPCSGSQRDAGTHTIRASPGGGTPPAVQELLFQAQVSAGREQRQRELAASQAFAEPDAPAAPPRRKGYRCTAGRGFGEKVVYQHEPCPELMETGLQPFSHVETDTSDPLRPRTETTTVYLPVLEATTQEEVSPRKVCEAKRAAQDPYERYKNPARCD